MAEEAGSRGVIGSGEDTGSVVTSGEQPSGKSSSSGVGEGFAASFLRSCVLAAWQAIWEAVWLTGLLNTRQ